MQAESWISAMSQLPWMKGLLLFSQILQREYTEETVETTLKFTITE